MTRYVSAETAHQRDTWAGGAREELPPLIHAVHPSMPKASRTGRNYRAACGASVCLVHDGTPFPSGRPCRACLRALHVIEPPRRPT